MFEIANIRRHKAELIVGVDAEGLLCKIQDHRLDFNKPSMFRPTAFAANLMIGSIIVALRGGKSYQSFDFISADGYRVYGQFQEVENTTQGVFKRALIIVEPAKKRTDQLPFSYILVIRDEELLKLKDILEKTYGITP